MQDVKKLAHLATGIDTKMADILQRAVPPHKYCEDCAITTMTKIHSRIPHRQDPIKRELVPGVKISPDIAGGGQIKPTKGGTHYYVSFICEATDMVWIYMMKFKTRRLHARGKKIPQHNTRVLLTDRTGANHA
jgi:hypothetical protein